MTAKPRFPDLYVLDALANDVEDLDSILRMLNSNTSLGWVREWGRPFHRSELVNALSRLTAKNYVQVLVLTEDGRNLEPLAPTTLPPGSFEDVYFAMTDRGRTVHRTWEPSVESEGVPKSGEPNEVAE